MKAGNTSYYFPLASIASIGVDFKAPIIICVALFCTSSACFLTDEEEVIVNSLPRIT